MPTSNIPVFMYGSNVGVAAIREDGTLNLMMEKPIKFTADLKEQFDHGEIEGLFLELAAKPLPPVPVDVEPANT